jgi:hypothetical protein
MFFLCIEKISYFLRVKIKHQDIIYTPTIVLERLLTCMYGGFFFFFLIFLGVRRLEEKSNV